MTPRERRGKASVNCYEGRATFDAPPEVVVDAVVAVLERMGASRIETDYQPPRVLARTKINWTHWREQIHARITSSGALVVTSRACAGSALGVAKHKANVDAVLDGVGAILKGRTGPDGVIRRREPESPDQPAARGPLSRGGQITAAVVGAALALALLVLMETGIGFPAGLGRTMGRKLAFLLLGCFAGGVGLFAGTLWDFVAGAGLFAPHEADEEE